MKRNYFTVKRLENIYMVGIVNLTVFTITNFLNEEFRYNGYLKDIIKLSSIDLKVLEYLDNIFW